MDVQQNGEMASTKDVSPEALAKGDELAQAKAQAQEYLDGWKRAKADYANLQREADRARGELARFVAAGLVTELLPILDNFRKASGQKPAFDAKQVEQWVNGIELIHTRFETVLKNAGVSAIDMEGVPFDPSSHEAMMSEKREGASPGSVLKVLEPGYRLHDRVLRPAKVIVAE